MNPIHQPLFFHDGTERPIPRPSDPDEQSFWYSGKKKDHSAKNICIIDATGSILFLSPTYEGSVHDKRIADLEGYVFPSGSHIYQDTGFQGWTCDGAVIRQPKKKPRGGTLTDEEKLINRTLSSIRIRIEHAIGSVKRYRIVKDTIRLWRHRIRDKIMETCCGLHNFRLRYRPWNYSEIKS